MSHGVTQNGEINTIIIIIIIIPIIVVVVLSVFSVRGGRERSACEVNVSCCENTHTHTLST